MSTSTKWTDGDPEPATTISSRYSRYSSTADTTDGSPSRCLTSNPDPSRSRRIRYDLSQERSPRPAHEEICCDRRSGIHRLRPRLGARPAAGRKRPRRRQSFFVQGTETHKRLAQDPLLHHLYSQLR